MYLYLYPAELRMIPSGCTWAFLAGGSNFLLQVTSPYGNTLHHQENTTIGQFAFTTTEAGNYLACFWMESGDKGASVSLDWKIGIAAKDWDSVARKEKIEVNT